MMDYYLSKVNNDEDVGGSYATLANELSRELEQLKIDKEALYKEVKWVFLFSINDWMSVVR